jgi:hypothetical protein
MKHEIKEIADLIKFTPKQLDDILIDIKQWHEVMKPAIEMAEKLGIKYELKKFVWVDDGKHDLKFKNITKEKI